MNAIRTAFRLASLLAGAATLLVPLGCEQETTWVSYVRETCADNVDNDADGKLDCDDSDCQLECSVDISMVSPPPTAVESTEVFGISRNAQSITLSVTSPGSGGTATPDATTGEWSFMVKDLFEAKSYTVTAVANGPKNFKDTTSVTVERRP